MAYRIQCSEMNASKEEWRQYYLKHWKDIYNDSSSPAWLKSVAKIFLEKR